MNVGMFSPQSGSAQLVLRCGSPPILNPYS